MSDELRKKLKEEILNAFWRDLKIHAERQALFLVTPHLDLVDVGEAIVSDDTKQVGEWITDASIQRPTPVQIEAWDQDPTRSFRSLIVAPYVLMQELGH